MSRRTASHLRARLKLRDGLPKGLTCVAVSRKSQFLAMWASPLGFLIVLLTWQLASPEWLLQDTARRKPTASSVLILQVTHNDFCHMLLDRIQSQSTTYTSREGS